MLFYNQKVITALIMLLATAFTPLSLMAETQSGVSSSIHNYAIPDVNVVRQDGKKLNFIKELDDGRPVILNFVFASCSAICPMLSHTFSSVQTQLIKAGKPIHLISISIDPENDTPATLAEYAQKFKAKHPTWDFYTGSMESSLSIQKAFDAYRGDKMNHSSVILMRAKSGKPWHRLEGFATADKVMREYDTMLKD